MAQEGNGSLFVFMEGDYKSAQLHCMVFQVILHIKLFRVCGKNTNKWYCKIVILNEQRYICIPEVLYVWKSFWKVLSLVKNVALSFKYEEIFTTLYPDTSH